MPSAPKPPPSPSPPSPQLGALSGFEPEEGTEGASDVEDTMVSPIYSPAVEAMSIERYAELTHRERQAATQAERRRVFDMFGLQDQLHRARLGREMSRLFADKPALLRRFDQALERLSGDR